MAQEERAGDLYAVEPEAFTEARNALVKELRTAGRRDDAARVAKLRRPPPTAWALNQVARTQPDVVDAVLAAGTELREAMERALDGDPSGVRDAQAAERRAVDAAVGAATRMLVDAGKGAADSAKLRMAGSLRAAVVDPSVADLLRRGVLDSDRDAPGFGLDGLSEAAGPTPARGRRPATSSKRSRMKHEEGGDDDRAAAEAAERRRMATEADEAEDRARRLEREAVDAERKAGQLADAAADAAAAAERASRRAEELEAEAREAAERAADARAEADAADAHARDARHRADGP